MTASLSPPGTPLRPLAGRQVALVMAVSLGAMVAAAALGVVLAATVLHDDDALALGVLLGTAGAWAGLWLTLSRASAWGWRELGFVRPRRSPWHLLWQVPAALLLGGIAAGLLGNLLGIGGGGTSTSDQELVDAATVGPWSLVVVGLCGVLVLPAAEEVLFRRVLLDWLLTRLRPGLAVLLAAAAFAVVHVAPAAMVYVVFLGLFACLLRLWHGSLWAPLALHACNNALVGVAAATAL